MTIILHVKKLVSVNLNYFLRDRRSKVSRMALCNYREQYQPDLGFAVHGDIETILKKDKKRMK